MTAAMHEWTPASWRPRRALQQPEYRDAVAADAILKRIAAAGPIVRAEDCARLRLECAAAARGESFILQAGDCAESLSSDPPAAALAMSELIEQLSRAAGGHVVAIGRIGGQFAKPRSAAEEQRGRVRLPAYRGDSINGAEFEALARAHDPARLGQAYRHSAETMAWLRANRPGLFASHEALVLPYEEALAFRDEGGRWWAGSGHMLWIGERTRQADGAHVAFAAGVSNVTGVKCGPEMDADKLVRLADALDPAREPGRLLLIARLGAEAIAERLPLLLRAARSEGLAASWILDPMHGNTRRSGGRKQRRLADMLAETEAFVAICRAEGVHMAGLHLEVTPHGQPECIGLDEIDPAADFPCDPRLTLEQAEQIVAAARC